MRLCASAIFAISSSSARVNTFPTGLCGVFSRIIFVFDVTARLERQNQHLTVGVHSSDAPQLVKVDRPGLLPDLDVRGGLGAGVEGDVDAFPAVEGDGREVLVEEGLEDNDFVPRLDERRERGVLPCITRCSAWR